MTTIRQFNEYSSNEFLEMSDDELATVLQTKYESFELGVKMKNFLQDAWQIQYAYSEEEFIHIFPQEFQQKEKMINETKDLCTNAKYNQLIKDHLDFVLRFSYEFAWRRHFNLSTLEPRIIRDILRKYQTPFQLKLNEELQKVNPLPFFQIVSQLEELGLPQKVDITLPYIQLPTDRKFQITIQ